MPRLSISSPWARPSSVPEVVPEGSNEHPVVAPDDIDLLPAAAALESDHTAPERSTAEALLPEAEDVESQQNVPERSTAEPLLAATGAVESQQTVPERKRKLSEIIAEPVARVAKRLRCSLGVTPANAKLLLTEPGEPVKNEGRDNAEHDYICRIGETICQPETGVGYEIMGYLGTGVFGQVIRCNITPGTEKASSSSRKRKDNVALKIIKHKDFYKDVTAEAQDEVDILRNILTMPQGSRNPSKHIVQLLDSFVYYGHLCIAFELLGPDLYMFLERHGKPGLPLAFIRSVTLQMLEALQCLQEASVIHADLKPENVLLVDACLSIVQKRKPHIKLIDFGAARTGETFAAMQPGTFVIQTLPYRAPEVLLGLPFTCTADMWSLGCICVELLLGRPLFIHGGNEHDVVSNAIDLLGPLPDHMLQAGRNTSKYFHKESEAAASDASSAQGRWSKFHSILSSFFRSWPTAETNNKQYVYRLKQYKRSCADDPITSLEQAVNLLRFEMLWLYACVPHRLQPEALQKQRRGRLNFLDFLGHLLHMNPEQRWNASQASTHCFVKEGTYRHSHRRCGKCSVRSQHTEHNS